MPLKGGKRKYKKRQRKTKRKRVKRKNNKKKRKMSRKLNLKGAGLFQDVKDFMGNPFKKKEPEQVSEDKNNCPKPQSTGDRLNNLFGRFRKTATDAAGAAKNAGNQALGEVTDIAEAAKDKALGAADGAKSALIGKDNYTWDEMKKSYESGFDDAKASKKKFDSLEKLKHKDKGELTKEDKEKELKEKKEEEDKKDPKMEEVKVSVEEETKDKPEDKNKDEDKEKPKDKPEIEEVDVSPDTEGNAITLESPDFDIDTIDDLK